MSNNLKNIQNMDKKHRVQNDMQDMDKKHRDKVSSDMD